MTVIQAQAAVAKASANWKRVMYHGDIPGATREAARMALVSAKTALATATAAAAAAAASE